MSYALAVREAVREAVRDPVWIWEMAERPAALKKAHTHTHGTVSLVDPGMLRKTAAPQEKAGYLVLKKRLSSLRPQAARNHETALTNGANGAKPATVHAGGEVRLTGELKTVGDQLTAC